MSLAPASASAQTAGGAASDGSAGPSDDGSTMGLVLAIVAVVLLCSLACVAYLVRSQRRTKSRMTELEGAIRTTALDQANKRQREAFARGESILSPDRSLGPGYNPGYIPTPAPDRHITSVGEPVAPGQMIYEVTVERDRNGTDDARIAQREWLQAGERAASRAIM